jgi:hypothetical protein
LKRALRCPKSEDRWECGEFELPAKVAERGERPFFFGRGRGVSGS